MRLKRIAILVGKEFLYGSKNFIFIFAVVIPVLLSLLISLMVGTLFSGKPRLGVADLGPSQLPGNLARLDYLVVREYDSAEALRQEVARGAVDVGIVLPTGFDAALQQGAAADLDLFLWGESLLKNRTLLAVTLVRQIIELAGRDVPVETVTTLLGEEANIPWDVRLFPLVVIMTIILGGTMVPAASIVEEKQKHTLTALSVTPVSLGDVLTAKAATGVLLSVGMGLVILTINRAFGAKPGLMILIIVLSAAFAASVGVILGTWVKDINTLFTVLKSLGIFLYAPALVYLFPQIPEWVARIFPTYYMIGPIVNMSLYNAAWADVASDVYVLCALIMLMVGLAGLVARRRGVEGR
ncbi:MAG: ABC transporter permease [Anaerolineae bacterium]